MKLSYKTLIKFAKGAVHYTVDRGYLTLFRYSKEQLDFMAREDYDRGWRNYAKFSGGIRLEFYTDAENISFDYRASCSHERSNTVDLYVDGVLHSVYTIGDKLLGSVAFPLPAGEKRVTVYYPCESRFEIKNFTLDGGYRTVKDKGPKVLVIGDSITQGAGPQIASAAYLHSLTRKMGYTVLGQGVGGYRYEARDLMKIEGFEPDKIIVFLGTNFYEAECLQQRGYDYAPAVQEFYKRLTELYPNKQILAVTPLWRNNNVNWPRFLWCIDRIKKACAEHPTVTVVDGLTLVPNVDECFSDGVHPNAYGSELLATNLAKVIKDIKF
ncbi:MAG: SGNH/GDSL hydrolase family protein [Clostridia bacterium]|nr:SGNH/GDSL hydrolase family protein [Clostridia bacterium]